MIFLFKVRNGAIGNNPCFPYDACVATHMGTDIDILTWEQSMNCGRLRSLLFICIPIYIYIYIYSRE